MRPSRQRRAFLLGIASCLILTTAVLAVESDDDNAAKAPSELPIATVRVALPGKAISPDLFGIFFEDINYAADGGLYAELVQNRSFEYSRVDNRAWNGLTAWDLVEQGDAKARVTVESATPLHVRNPHYAVLTVTQAGDRVGLRNTGFDGIVIQAGEKYDVSLFARTVEGQPGPIAVRLERLSGELLGQARFSELTDDWSKHTAVIIAEAGDNNARLVVLASGTGSLALDMVSLFPQKTFFNRPNGLRPDLAQAIADLKPKFFRFPGGCLAHGDGLENMYRWKDTIGPVEQRKAQRNIWRYHQTMGLGYFEYFQFCEDIGAKPLPVVPAGVCCQNSGNYLNLVPRGQQGIPMDEMPAYVQEVLDLIEYANGPATSGWGAERAKAGHPQPFHLEYLGVGNEDVISPAFKQRYQMINDAIQAKYPEITVIGTTGPFTDGQDYEEGWKFARELKLPMVDEHGYKSPQWFWENLERFDAYDHTGPQVYLGEYAAHDRNRANTLRSALAEAAYMTSLERNGDLVRLVSYAPLLAKQGRTQWRPDMIYFDNLSITLSANYHVQQLFSVNQGDTYLPTTVTVKTQESQANDAAAASDKVPDGVLLGTWNSQARFDNVTVVDQNGTVANESFEQPAEDWKVRSGRWVVSDGTYSQSSNEEPALSRLAFTANRQGYTLSLRAMKTGGAEGFLIGFGAFDTDSYYWWNLGGWGNTRHAVERSVDGNKSMMGQSVPGAIEANRWYDIKIEVTDKRVQCHLDGVLLHDFPRRDLIATPDLAASCVQNTATGEIIIKLVSKAAVPIRTTLDLSALGPFAPTATQTLLAGDPLAENRFGQPVEVAPHTSEIAVTQTTTVELPSPCLMILRLQRP